MNTKLSRISLCNECAHFIEFRKCDDSDVKFLKSRSRFSYTPDESSISPEEYQHDIDHLDIEIHRLRSKVFELEEARGYLQQCQYHAKTLLSPIRRVPDDVLGEIFSLVAQAGSLDRDAKHSRSNNPIPIQFLVRYADAPKQTLLLSQVCYAWRNITTSSPKIWTFDIRRIQMCQMLVSPLYIRTVSHYLEMSKPLSTLSLELLVPFGLYREMVRVVLAHSDRWRSVIIHRSPDTLEDIAEELRTRSCPVTGFFPNLEEVDLRGAIHLKDYYSDRLDSMVHWADCFSVAPKLRSLVVGYYSPGPSFPYSQLESLTFNESEWNEDWKFLGLCTKLKRLIILDGPLRSDGSFPASPIVFPSLLFLKLAIRSLPLPHRPSSVQRPKSLGFIFSKITAPSLECLHVFSPDGFETRILVDLITRSSCSLNELCMDWKTGQQPDGLFRLAPEISKLQIRCNRIHPDYYTNWGEDLPLPPPLAQDCAGLVDLLGVGGLNSTEGIVLPRLSNLILFIPVDERLMGRVAAMVGLRCKHTFLKSFTLLAHTTEDVMPDVPPELQNLGVSLEIRPLERHSYYGSFMDAYA